jgi:transposase
MPKKYVVQLKEHQRELLSALIQQGNAVAHTVRRAHTLLLADEQQPVQMIAAMLHTSAVTVTPTCKRLLTAGLETALYDRPRPGSRRKLDGRQEAHLVALACSMPSAGRDRWRLRLLADRVVELGLVEDVSYATVRRVLKKNTRKPWLTEPWCIPKPSAEFVARMEDLLDLYEEPDDPQRPRVCFDERPCQLLADSREPRPMAPRYPMCCDYAYIRHGPCHLFIMAEPVQRWRHLRMTPPRTTQEFAQCMAELVDVHFPQAEKIRVVLDNLSTHTPAALYAVFPPAEVGRLLRKLEFHLTPGHGRWLNMAEIELAVLARQCLTRRVPDVLPMIHELAAWEARRNRHQAMIDWRFTTKDARIKLKSLYSKYSE